MRPECNNRDAGIFVCQQHGREASLHQAVMSKILTVLLDIMSG
jgi:hypothetical protein